jgi:S1-C subfamily serine protease
VGINGRITIRDRGRVNTGVGFAVSINQIRNFLPDLLAGKHAEHGTLDMNAWWMKDPNTGGEEGGIFVQGLFEDSVAAKAGLKLGTSCSRSTARSSSTRTTSRGTLVSCRRVSASKSVIAAGTKGGAPTTRPRQRW